MDDKTHCNEWFSQYWLVIATVVGIAVLVIVGNVFVEVLIQQGSRLTRPLNENEIIRNAVRAISWIQFINLGLILFVIEMGIKLGNFAFPFGILQGSYDDFSSMWYIDVGT